MTRWRISLFYLCRPRSLVNSGVGPEGASRHAKDLTARWLTPCTRGREAYIHSPGLCEALAARSPGPEIRPSFKCC
jgi:hypothetical protein